MNKKNSLILVFLITLVILLLVLLNFFLPNVLDFFEGEHTESTKISVEPELLNEEDNIYLVNINFRTLDDSGVLNEISAVSFSLSYPNDPSNRVDVVSIDGLSINSVEPGDEINEEQNWEVPINEVVKDSEGVRIDFAAVNVSTDGFTSGNGTTLAKIYFKAQQPLLEDSFILNFDADNTIILTKTTPTKNIRGDETDLYYAVEE